MYHQIWLYFFTILLQNDFRFGEKSIFVLEKIFENIFWLIFTVYTLHAVSNRNNAKTSEIVMPKYAKRVKNVMPKG